MSDKQPQFASGGTPAYATEYAHRYPRFKVHKTLGHARAARTHRYPTRIFTWGRYDSEEKALEHARQWIDRMADFDIYKWDGTGWKHMPEESLIPREVYDVEVKPSVYGGFSASPVRKETK